jgi:hypothetical protein
MRRLEPIQPTRVDAPTHMTQVVPAAALPALKGPVAPPRGAFHCRFSKGIAMNDGFPPHIVGFMNRKREKEKREGKA